MDTVPALIVCLYCLCDVFHVQCVEDDRNALDIHPKYGDDKSVSSDNTESPYEHRDILDIDVSNIANHNNDALQYDVQKTRPNSLIDNDSPILLNHSSVTNVSETAPVPIIDSEEDHETTADEDAPIKSLRSEIRLPTTVRPSLYEISIFPHIYSDDSKNFWFQCETDIHISTSENVTMVYLHSVYHDISDIRIKDVTTNDTWRVLFRQNDRVEMIEIDPLRVLRSGQRYVISIVSSSHMSIYLRGFYYSPYKEDGKTKYIFTTMMEPTDARQVFPCFDEPDFKALFTFKITRRAHLTSVTNLPRRETIGPEIIDSHEYYTDIFDDHRGVPMSTYLVAIAIGELECLVSSVNGITFRTWSRPEAVNKTRYALEVGMQFMEFFENYFQIPYSLPKEDMIAVPTMSFSGMEHWGLITYRESALLYEEGVSSLVDMEWTTVLVAHEIAHQWFGNLVSPYWWDDLWLNEGFATYMMFLAVDRVMPTWKMINKLITDTRGVHTAMGVDDVINSHPVYVAVYDPVEINQIFDLISYAKGGAIIRMMNFFLGEDTFRQGLTNYLNKFSYKTATHNDLWNALSEQAKRDNVSCSDVKSIMDTWVLETNYPVVMVKRLDDVTLEISQSAFLQTERGRANRSNVRWKIPFVYTTDVENNFNKEFADITWLNHDSVLVTDYALQNASWIIGNVQQYGFYRMNYESDNWLAILNQLYTDHTRIHPINRAQIINDAWNLASAGLLDFSVALSTLDYLDMETDIVPWKAALRELAYVNTALELTPMYGLFQMFMQRKLRSAYYASYAATDHYERLEYSLIAENACMNDMPECIQDALDKFNAWTNDTNISIDPDLKNTVYCIGVRYNGYDAWLTVFERFLEVNSISEKRFLAQALTCTDSPWLIMLLSEKAFKDAVFSKTERVDVIINLSRTPVGRLLSWNIIESNWDFLMREYGDGVNLISGIIDAVVKSFNTETEYKRLTNFIKDHEDLGNAYPSLHAAVDSTRANINWMNTYYETIRKWLNKHK